VGSNIQIFEFKLFRNIAFWSCESLFLWSFKYFYVLQKRDVSRAGVFCMDLMLVRCYVSVMAVLASIIGSESLICGRGLWSALEG